ncbi:MAG: CPBP family intramembrane metalloprotease [Flavobacteriales bacterium]
MKTQNRIRLFGLATLLGMPLLAFVISWLFSLEFPIIGWFITDNFLVQLTIGVFYGVLVGIMASWITERNFMSSVRNRYYNLLSSLNLTWFDVFFISICAGIGEEILFRYALQYVVGIWIAALLFVAVHGYLNPKDWRISVYGLFMVLASAGFGYMAEELGMLSAIIAHAAVDVYLLAQLKLEDKKTTFESIKYDQD